MRDIIYSPSQYLYPYFLLLSNLGFSCTRTGLRRRRFLRTRDGRVFFFSPTNIKLRFKKQRSEKLGQNPTFLSLSPLSLRPAQHWLSPVLSTKCGHRSANSLAFTTALTRQAVQAHIYLFFFFHSEHAGASHGSSSFIRRQATQ